MCLECPLHDTIKGRFPTLFKYVLLGRLKSFYQVNHRLDTGCFLIRFTASICYRKELVALTLEPICCQIHGLPLPHPNCIILGVKDVM